MLERDCTRERERDTAQRDACTPLKKCLQVPTCRSLAEATQKYELGEVLGKGVMGKVYRSGGYAIKVLYMRPFILLVAFYSTVCVWVCVYTALFSPEALPLRESSNSLMCVPELLLWTQRLYVYAVLMIGKCAFSLYMFLAAEAPNFPRIVSVLRVSCFVLICWMALDMYVLQFVRWRWEC